MQGALLCEQGADDTHKSLIATRFCRTKLAPERTWDDRIAFAAGRELLAFAELDPGRAELAAT